MILAKSEILKAIEDNDIVIQPFNPKNLGSNSYDVTLNNKLLVYTDAVLDCKNPPRTKEIVIPEEGLVLLPNKIYIGCINEYTETHNLLPVMHGKSSLGRLGLSAHICAGMGDIGFCGKWTLEITVVQPLKIYPNMQIAQIVYHDVVGSGIYGGKYQGDTQAMASKFYRNFQNE